MAPGTVVAQDARLEDAIAAAARTDPAETQGTSRASSRAAAAFREGQRRRNEGARTSITQHDHGNPAWSVKGSVKMREGLALRRNVFANCTVK